MLEQHHSFDEHSLERVAEEILESRRRGDRKTIEDYCQQYPDLASKLRTFLPALLAVENLKPDSSDEQGGFEAQGRMGGSPPRQIGDYDILREIGRGGMGIVYEAEQQSLGRRVALKVLPRHFAGEERALIRFQREAKAAARMHHTNIVPVFDVGSDNDHVYYAMQLISGQSLDLVIRDLRLLRKPGSNGHQPDVAPSSAGIARSLLTGEFRLERLSQHIPDSENSDEMLESNGTVDDSEDNTETYARLRHGTRESAALPGNKELSVVEGNRKAYYSSVAQIGFQAVSALSYAHARGIIHRDIKPSNLLLDSTGTVWIVDFGLAKTSEVAVTHTGDLLGTIRYMSPERFRGMCDPRADIYSLGLTLYEMLSLQPAFSSSDQLNLIDQIKSTDTRPLRASDPSIPRDLETIVLKAIEKDPKRRYQSADEMADDLERFVHGEPVRARRISLPERFSRWAARNRGIAASVSIVIMLLLTLVGVLAYGTQHFKKLAEEKVRLADKERQASTMAQERLARSTVMRLASQSQSVRESHPVQSLLLAAEAVKLSQATSEVAMPSAHQELMNAVPRIGGRVLKGHAAGITSAAFSPDSRWLATSSRDKTARIWDLHQVEAEGKVFARHTSPISIVLSGNDWFVAAGEQGSLTVKRTTDALQQDAGISLLGHETEIRAAALSFDERFLATGDSSGRVLVWDLAASVPKLLAELAAHESSILSLQFDPTGKWFATGTELGNVRLWDASFSSTDFSHTILDAHARTLNSRETVNTWKPPAARVRSIEFSSDGRWLLTACGDYTCRQWDLNSASLRESERVFVGHTYALFDVAMSPDARFIATGSDDSTAMLWDVRRSASPAQVLRHDRAVLNVAFSPDGQLLTSSEDGTAAVWETAAIDPTRHARILRGHEAPIIAMEVSPDGTRLVTGCENGELRLWQLSSRNPAGSSSLLLGHNRDVVSLNMSPNGRWLASASLDWTVRLWDMQADDPSAVQRLLEGHEDGVEKVVVSDKSAVSVSRDGTVRRWNLQDSSSEIVARIPSTAAGGRWENPLWSISPDGRYVLNRTRGGLIQAWDLATEQDAPIVLTTHRSRPRIAFDPEVRRMVSVSEDMIHVWNLDKLQDRRHAYSLENAGQSLTSAIFVNSSTVVASTKRGRLLIWNLNGSNRATPRMALGHQGPIQLMAVQRDEQRLATFGRDGGILLWKLKGSELQRELKLSHGHALSVIDAVFSPSGRWLASASADRTVHLWDLHAEDVATSMRELRGHFGTVAQLVFASDETWLASASSDGAIRRWTLDLEALLAEAEVKLAGRELSHNERMRYGVPSRPATP